MTTTESGYCWKIVRPDELSTPWLRGRSHSQSDRVAAHVEQWAGEPLEITILSWEESSRGGS